MTILLFEVIRDLYLSDISLELYEIRLHLSGISECLYEIGLCISAISCLILDEINWYLYEISFSTLYGISLYLHEFNLGLHRFGFDCLSLFAQHHAIIIILLLLEVNLYCSSLFGQHRAAMFVLLFQAISLFCLFSFEPELFTLENQELLIFGADRLFIYIRRNQCEKFIAFALYLVLAVTSPSEEPLSKMGSFLLRCLYTVEVIEDCIFEIYPGFAHWRFEMYWAVGALFAVFGVSLWREWYIASRTVVIFGMQFHIESAFELQLRAARSLLRYRGD